MPANPVAENVLGTIGTICWTIQLLPQIWKSWREKSTQGLSHWLVLVWGISGAFLGVYSVVQNLNIPLILQPQLFTALSLVSWCQCLYYDKKWPFARCAVIFISTCIALGGFEAGMIFAITPAYDRGNIRAVQFFGVFSSVLISAALVPQYIEIWKYKEVLGISVLFMVVDLMGGVFSDLSLAFKAEFDVIAGITYSLVVVLDGIVILMALILNPRAERRRKREAELRALEEAAGDGVDTVVMEETTSTPPTNSSEVRQADARTSSHSILHAGVVDKEHIDGEVVDNEKA
ncbi:hypothetical protein PLICRDRAFT_258225 [Plicaturopsis crispa FD-325 SS-3]|nr:hypothetical protein PLICRDRAFT_258225 [Plicaturopsis crispa FD-325 SS-3]